MIPLDNDFDFSTMPASDRLLLAHQLLDSVLTETCPLTAEQLDDIRQRTDEIDTGQVTCDPWPVVRARLRDSLK